MKVAKLVVAEGLVSKQNKKEINWPIYIKQSISRNSKNNMCSKCRERIIGKSIKINNKKHCVKCAVVKIQEVIREILKPPFICNFNGKVVENI